MEEYSTEEYEILKRQFEDFEDEIIYIRSSLTHMNDYGQNKFPPLFIPSCYRMLAVFCADLLDNPINNFISNCSGRNLQVKISERLEELGYDSDFSAFIQTKYMGLRHLRNYITHRGYDSGHQTRSEAVIQSGLKLNTRDANISDINHLLRIYFASFLVFNNYFDVDKCQRLIKIAPVFDVVIFEEIKVEHKLYSEKNFKGMVYHNLKTILEVDGLINKSSIPPLIWSWEYNINHSSFLNPDILHNNKRLIEKISKLCETLPASDKSNAVGAEFLKLDDTTKKQFIEIRMNARSLVRNISWITGLKRFEVLADNEEKIKISEARCLAQLIITVESFMSLLLPP